jgi:hypothetical protein
MAWDGIRGIDLLLSRPEVDATRIASRHFWRRHGDDFCWAWMIA